MGPAPTPSGARRKVYISLLVLLVVVCLLIPAIGPPVYARCEGYYAGQQGAMITDNPYKEGDFWGRDNEWRQGWQKGGLDRQEEKVGPPWR